VTGKPFNADRTVLFQIVPLGFLCLFVVALLVISLERRRHKSLLAVIEEESKVPTESQIEPAHALTTLLIRVESRNAGKAAQSAAG
jgi:hypothetical protein